MKLSVKVASSYNSGSAELWLFSTPPMHDLEGRRLAPHATMKRRGATGVSWVILIMLLDLEEEHIGVNARTRPGRGETARILLSNSTDKHFY